MDISKGLPKNLCKECFTICTSHAMCLRMQDFNLIVSNAQAMAKLKKTIKISAPQFTGRKEWFESNPYSNFVERKFDESTEWKSRFITITFDPRKFTLNQLTQPVKLLHYAFNALNDLKFVFSKNIIAVVEYHKSGIPHIHLNYEVKGPLEHATVILRLRYYFSKDLRNRRAIHDRVFNEGGTQYIKKSNQTYLEYRLMEGETCGLEPNIVKL
jgi:hypothetical protein